MVTGAQVRMVSAKFELPEVFVRAYHGELSEWGREFSKQGRCKFVLLRKIPGAPVTLDRHGQEPYLGVNLIASVERISSEEVRLRIEAEDEISEMLIAKHCEAIARYGMPEARKDPFPKVKLDRMN